MALPTMYDTLKLVYEHLGDPADSSSEASASAPTAAPAMMDSAPAAAQAAAITRVPTAVAPAAPAIAPAAPAIAPAAQVLAPAAQVLAPAAQVLAPAAQVIAPAAPLVARTAPAIAGAITCAAAGVFAPSAYALPSLNASAHQYAARAMNTMNMLTAYARCGHTNYAPADALPSLSGRIAITNAAARESAAPPGSITLGDTGRREDSAAGRPKGWAPGHGPRHEESRAAYGAGATARPASDATTGAANPSSTAGGANRVPDASRAAATSEGAEPAVASRTAATPAQPSAAEPAHSGARWGGVADDDDGDNDPQMILTEETNATCKGFPPHWRVRKVNARVYHVFSPAGEQYTSLKAAKQALDSEGDDVCWECRGPGAFVPSLSRERERETSGSLTYRAQVSYSSATARSVPARIIWSVSV